MVEAQPKRHFCTYADENYLPNVLALLESLRRHAGSFHLQLLCLTPEASRQAAALEAEDFTIFSLETLEKEDPELLKTKNTRSRIEYYFTITPCWTLAALKRQPSSEWITYIDADTYFYDSPETIFDQIKGKSIGITPHRFRCNHKHLEIYGLYNVGWVSFRRNKEGIACLEKWKKDCLEWCYDRASEDRFADQKYLDTWPLEYPGTEIISNPSVNLALWNINSQDLIFKNGKVYVESNPLIFFHFSALKQISDSVFDPDWGQYGVKPSRILKNYIYKPYLRCVKNIKYKSKTAILFKSVRSIEKTKNYPPLSNWKVFRRCLLGRYVYIQ
jgi:hypothetical protein